MILELAPAPEPSLDNFFPGRNGAAMAAIAAVLDGAERFVYVWGMAGCGKSHLLHALVHGARSLGLRAGYARAPQLDVVMPLDVLAADDVQNLDIVSQLCLFDAYNNLRALGGAIVAAGDRPPKDLPLREDLRTRIAAGPVLQVHPLSEDEKRAALLRHAASRGVKLGDEVIGYLLNRHARDMGSLVAIVDALDRYSLQTQRAVTLALVREALRNPE